MATFRTSLAALPLFSLLSLTILGFGAGCGGSVAGDHGDSGADTGTPGVDTGDPPLYDTGIYPPPPYDSGFPPPADGGGRVCSRSNDHVDISMTGSHTGTCSGTGPTPRGTTSFDGRVVAIVDDTTVQIDTCPPTADCVAIITTLSIKAPGLSLFGAVIKGSLVHVDVTFLRDWTCTSSVVMTSLSDWDGEKNPVDVGGRLYVAAVDGMTSIPGVAFTVAEVSNGCLPGVPSCGGGRTPDLYALRFTSSTANTVVPMGETTYGFSAGSQPLQVRNLRSFYEGACDAYWDFAWWAAPGFLPD